MIIINSYIHKTEITLSYLIYAITHFQDFQWIFTTHSSSHLFPPLPSLFCLLLLTLLFNMSSWIQRNPIVRVGGREYDRATVTDIVVPDGVTRIDDSTFNECLYFPWSS